MHKVPASREEVKLLALATTIPADSVVVAAGAAPEVSLVDTLRARGLKVYPIGDCVSPGKIADAVRDGARVGQEI